MLVAIFLKSYKIYKNIKFIPLSDSKMFTALIGQNGTGKSSVLEALDSYFNNREWNINKQTRSGGGIVYINTPYVAPVFLIKKTDIKTSTAGQKDYFAKLEKASNYFWKIDRKRLSSSSPEITEFLRFRDDLTEHILSDDYFLIIAGKRYEQQNKVYFGPFHHQDSFLSHIGYIPSTEGPSKEDYLSEDAYIQSIFSDFSEITSRFFSYVYIPSDIDVSDYTKLETEDMQKLMDKSIKEIIQNTIKQSSLDEINKSLAGFIEDITKKLDAYTYRKPTGGKANITMPDLVSTIIKEFFSIRYLTKKVSGEYIPVQNLSSGEKRKSLIDLAFAFLFESERKEKIILAIDEPEISLHVSACFDQFEKLISLSEDGNQVLITTHWYGFLPVAQSGSAVFLNMDEEKVIAEIFSLGNYREKIVQLTRKEKGKVPFDVFLKSNYDLVQSIVLSVRKPNKYRWILCEGQSEKIYFSHIFKKEIEEGNLRILPLGGCGEVIKIYENLQVAIDERDKDVLGRVLAIIDTDEQKTKFEPIRNTTKIQFRRLYYKEGNVTLLELNSIDVANTTEIEDSLRSDLYRDVLLQVGTTEVKAIVAKETVTEGSVWSYDAMDLKASEEKKIKEFFDSADGNKTKFAKAYVNHGNFIATSEPLYTEILKYL